MAASSSAVTSVRSFRVDIGQRVEGRWVLPVRGVEEENILLAMDRDLLGEAEGEVVFDVDAEDAGIARRGRILEHHVLQDRALAGAGGPEDGHVAHATLPGDGEGRRDAVPILHPAELDGIAAGGDMQHAVAIRAQAGEAADAEAGEATPEQAAGIPREQQDDDGQPERPGDGRQQGVAQGGRLGGGFGHELDGEPPDQAHEHDDAEDGPLYRPGDELLHPNLPRHRRPHLSAPRPPAHSPERCCA